MNDLDTPPEASKPNMAWLLTFADLVSLLITFFVLLYSMKSVSSKTWDDLVGSFQGAFNIRKSIYNLKPDQTETVEKKDMLRSDDLAYIRSILTRYFAQNMLLRDVKMVYDFDADVLRIHLPSDILFESGTETIEPDGKTTLMALGDLLRHLDNRIEIAAYARAPETKTRRLPTAWELSMLRAIQAGSLLKAQGLTHLLTLSAYGDTTADPDSQHLNPDRLEIMIHREK